MIESVDRRLCVLAVVGADTYCVELFVVDKLFVAGIALNVFNAVLLEESFSLAGDKICAGYDFNVGHLLVAGHMSVCNPACSYNTYS